MRGGITSRKLLLLAIRNEQKPQGEDQELLAREEKEMLRLIRSNGY